MKQASIDATEWQGAMIIQFGGLRDAYPSYDGVEGGCLSIGGIGRPAGRTFLRRIYWRGGWIRWCGIFDRLREAVRGVRQRYPFHIDAWMVLPDHLHCLWTLPEGDTDFSTRWRLIKTTFTKALPATERRSTVRVAHHESQGQGLALLGALRMQRAIWQRRFWEHAIREERDYARHMDYSVLRPNEEMNS